MNRDDVTWKGYMLAAITPFNADGSIDESAFRQSLENEIRSGVQGLVVAGNTGESWALDDAEKRLLYELGAKQVAGRVPILAGTDAMRPSETIALARYAADLGMDGIMVLPPPCSVPRPHEIVAFYEAISSAAPIPILLHNDPSRVVVNMSPELVSRLADIDHVVAIKEGCPDPMQELETIRLTHDRIRVMCGWPPRRALSAFAMGADGCVGGADVVLGGEAYAMWDLVQQGQVAKARRVQERLHALTRAFPAAGGFHAVLKEALRRLDRPAGHVRPPLLPLDEAGKGKVNDMLVDLRLL